MLHSKIDRTFFLLDIVNIIESIDKINIEIRFQNGNKCNKNIIICMPLIICINLLSNSLYFSRRIKTRLEPIKTEKNYRYGII